MKPLGQSKQAQRSALELQAAVRMPRDLYQAHLGPHAPRRGFTKHEPDVHDVLTTQRRNAGRANYSGTPAGY